jgi:hypothetical protein
MFNMPYCLFPDVRWFVAGNQQNQYPILKNAPFLKQNGHNRYAIGGPNGIQQLTVPVFHEDRNRPLPNVRINYSEKWVKDHKQAWQTAYGKSPFFEYYDYRFWALLDEQPETMETLIDGCNELLFSNLRIAQTPEYTEITNAQQSLIAQQLLAPYQQSIEKIEVIPYAQVFDTKYGFRTPLSALDLLFHLGPLSSEYFQQYPQVSALKGHNNALPGETM